MGNPRLHVFVNTLHGSLEEHTRSFGVASEIQTALVVQAAVSLSDRLCGLVVRVLGYRSGGPGLIPGTTRKKNVVGLERGSLSLLSTN
jgi:hypothetical protein